MEKIVPKGHLILRCELCKTDIGTFDPKTLKSPVDSTMFGSINPNRKLPPPFPIVPGRSATLKWQFALCPYCRNRPWKINFEGNKESQVTGPTRFLTPHGYFYLDKPDEIPHIETLSEIRQKELDRKWAESEDNISLEEENQKLINEMFPEEEEKPFICKFCGNGYAHHSSMYRHQKICKVGGKTNENVS